MKTKNKKGLVESTLIKLIILLAFFVVMGAGIYIIMTGEISSLWDKLFGWITN
tara:strand:- start:16499 stop:16657 length:159 start_codon:yes stop_codon:yes gene_type:complete